MKRKTINKYLGFLVFGLAVLLSKGCKCQKTEPKPADYSDFKVTYKQQFYDEPVYVECDTCSYIILTFYVSNVGADSVKWYINDEFVGQTKGGMQYDFRYKSDKAFKVKSISHKTICGQEYTKEYKCSTYVHSTTKYFYLKRNHKHFYGRYRGVYSYAPNDSVEINMAQIDTIGTYGTGCENKINISLSGGNNRIVPFMRDSTKPNLDPKFRCGFPVFYGNGNSFVFEGTNGFVLNGGYIKNGKGNIDKNGSMQIECVVYHDSRFTESEKKITFKGRRLEKYEYDPLLY